MSTTTVTATVGYHLEADRGGVTIWRPGTVSDKRRPRDYVDVKITNIRDNQPEYSLDTHGFEIRPFSTTAKNFDDSVAIANEYYPDVISHMRKVTGASKVIPITHISRRARWEEMAEAEKDLPDRTPVIAPTPNRSVHIDQSYSSAEMIRDSKLEKLPEEEAARLRSCRWAIINLWRPFNVVTRDNLAVCDARSVPESDLVVVHGDIPEELRNGSTGYNFTSNSRLELWEVKAGRPNAHKWYYASGMTPEEALLIKIFDSSKNVSARRCPHTAFSSEADHGPVRQSMEVRCLVFWENES